MATRENNAACKQFEEDLVLYHYDELDGAARDSITEHVKHCAPCRASLDELNGLMPKTVVRDEPPEAFWMDYSRELRRKIDAVAEKPSLWRSLTAWLRPLPLTAFATCAVVLLALTFTVGKKYWHKTEAALDDEEVAIMSSNQDLELLKNLEILDALDVLEVMSGDNRGA
jgi:hypothetical protein